MSPAKTVLARLNVTVDPEVETDETVMVSLLPPKSVRETENELARAVVVERVSLSMSNNSLPREFIDEAENVGGVVSGVYLTTTIPEPPLPPTPLLPEY